MSREVKTPDSAEFRFTEDDHPLYELGANETIAIARELYPAYPGLWLTLHIGETNPSTGMTPVRVLSHDKLGFENQRMVWEYRQRHPDALIRVVCTSLGVGRPVGQ